MTTTLEKIRAKINKAEQAKRPNSKKSSAGDGLTFPFWDKSAENGSTSVLRFLPDGNPDNTYFWVERQLIKLDFPGIKGYDEQKPVTIQVPCMEMWNETCPILTEVRQWFNGDQESENLARKYWKKRTYIFQGFVRESAIKEDSIPENPIRKFVMGPQLFGIIKAALMDEEMESLPIDYEKGLDFRLNKGEKGGFADYTKSSWARRESALTEDELLAVEKYGLVDLNTYLPEKPSAEGVSVIFDMFEASVAGELYDPERWAKFYKPYGLEMNSKDTSGAQADKPQAVIKPLGTQAKEETSSDDDVPFDVDDNATQSAPAASTSQATAKEILARIRRQQ